jgi:hypothetical protein
MLGPAVPAYATLSATCPAVPCSPPSLARATLTLRVLARRIGTPDLHLNTHPDAHHKGPAFFEYGVPGTPCVGMTCCYITV